MHKPRNNDNRKKGQIGDRRGAKVDQWSMRGGLKVLMHGWPFVSSQSTGQGFTHHKHHRREAERDPTTVHAGNPEDQIQFKK